jgi:hypothetical protein
MSKQTRLVLSEEELASWRGAKLRGAAVSIAAGGVLMGLPLVFWDDWTLIPALAGTAAVVVGLYQGAVAADLRSLEILIEPDRIVVRENGRPRVVPAAKLTDVAVNHQGMLLRSAKHKVVATLPRDLPGLEDWLAGHQVPIVDLARDNAAQFGGAILPVVFKVSFLLVAIGIAAFTGAPDFLVFVGLGLVVMVAALSWAQWRARPG